MSMTKKNHFVETFKFDILHFYRPQGKVMFSQAGVSLFTICLMATRSLFILVTSLSVHNLLECFLLLPTA